MPLTLWQAAVNPHLCQRLRDTHRQDCVSLLCCHCCFLLGPVHTSFCCSLQESVSLGVLSPFAGSPGWEICCNREENFCGVSFLQFVGCLLAGSTVALVVTSSRRTYATCCSSQACFRQSPCPHSRSLLTCTSSGKTQTLKGMSDSVSCGGVTAPFPGSWCTQDFVCTL